jgi:RNA 3'-terminal phosphate cyclase (ATP)
MILIDGGKGEGGGQVLRTALSLSLLTGKPFRISNIRGARKKPGLLRQHLTCVNAAVQISAAGVAGAELGSMELEFKPGKVSGGNYEFNVSSAGSVMLVFQTVVLPLLFTGKSSYVTFKGGTHNPMAPTFDFLKRSYLWRSSGVDFTLLVAVCLLRV